MKFPRWLVILWFACIVAVWVVRGLPWNLDEYDQAKQAYTSYEMVERGEWWFQHTPRQDAATKPPLVGWLSAGTYYLTHSWNVAWRVPSLVAAVAMLALLWRSGTWLAGMSGAFLATAAFSWNLLTIRLATMVRTDMVLTFFIFAAGWLIWRCLQLQTKWTWRETAVLTFLLTCATMTKGPIYHAFLLPGLVAWLCLAERAANQMNIAKGYLVASILSLLPFLLWTWLRMQQDPAFYEQVVVKEFLGRFTTGMKAVHNNQTWYFYFPHLLTKALPWSVLLVAGLCFKEKWLGLKKNPAALWLLCWLLGGLLAMSVVPSKRVDRIFPVIPVAALCLAGMLPFFLQKRWLQPRLLTWLMVSAMLGYGIYTGYMVRQGYRNQSDRLVLFGESVQKLCAEKRWNYTLVEGRDEGMLMYAGKLVFDDVKGTALLFKNGSIEAAVVDSKKLTKLSERAGPLQTVLKIAHPTDADYSYHLVHRLQP